MHKIVFIKDYVNNRLKAGEKLFDIAKDLGVSQSTCHYYHKGTNNPSLDTAIYIFRNKEITIHPFSSESLKYESDRLDESENRRNR